MYTRVFSGQAALVSVEAFSIVSGLNFTAIMSPDIMLCPGRSHPAAAAQGVANIQISSSHRAFPTKLCVVIFFVFAPDSLPPAQEQHTWHYVTEFFTTNIRAGLTAAWNARWTILRNENKS